MSRPDLTRLVTWGISLGLTAGLAVLGAPAARAVPNTPDAPNAVAGDGQVVVGMGRATAGTVTKYVVSAVSDPTKSCEITGSAGYCTITGLTNGTEYPIQAVAHDANGPSSPSMPTIGIVPGPCSVGQPSFSGGAGTAADPFLIADDTQFRAMTKYQPNCAYKLMADITLTNPWQPFGLWNPTTGSLVAGGGFSGHLLGNGKTVSGLTIGTTNGLDMPGGLFAVADGATISDLTLLNASVTRPGAPPYVNYNRLGLLVGLASGATSITHVTSSGTVTGGSHLGGLVGVLEGNSTIERGSSSASVSTTYVSDAWDVGGLVGRTQGSATITESRSSGVVAGASFVGGLVGGVWNTAQGGATISRSMSSATVSGTRHRIGGLVGFMQTVASTGSTISDSYATGTVTGRADPNVTPWRTWGTRVGGLVGAINKSAGAPNSVINSYAIGTVASDDTNATMVGGLVGGLESTGLPNVIIADSFWNPTDAGAGATSALGTQATAATMKTFALYDDSGWSISTTWNANKTWGICSGVNGDYPFLMSLASAGTCGFGAVTTPSSPTINAITPGDTQLTVSWTAPASDGGDPISDYVVQWRTSASPGPWTTFADGASTTTSVSLTGLTNGIEYDIRVAAVNMAGTGPYSSPITTATPQATPGPPPAPIAASAPRDVMAMAGDGSASVSWSAPVNPGSFPVTHYLVSSSPGGRLCLTASPSVSCDVEGLSNGTMYAFTVKALTGAGWSVKSDPSPAVTPFAEPRPAITITGSREGRWIVVTGMTTGMGVGDPVTPWASRMGRTSTGGTVVKGRAVEVSSDGSFRWSRRASERTTWSVYFTTSDGVRSRTITITGNSSPASDGPDDLHINTLGHDRV